MFPFSIVPIPIGVTEMLRPPSTGLIWRRRIARRRPATRHRPSGFGSIQEFSFFSPPTFCLMWRVFADERPLDATGRSSSTRVASLRTPGGCLSGNTSECCCQSGNIDEDPGPERSRRSGSEEAAAEGGFGLPGKLGFPTDVSPFGCVVS